MPQSRSAAGAATTNRALAAAVAATAEVVPTTVRVPAAATVCLEAALALPRVASATLTSFAPITQGALRAQEDAAAEVEAAHDAAVVCAVAFEFHAYLNLAAVSLLPETADADLESPEGMDSAWLGLDLMGVGKLPASAPTAALAVNPRPTCAERAGMCLGAQLHCGEQRQAAWAAVQTVDVQQLSQLESVPCPISGLLRRTLPRNHFAVGTPNPPKQELPMKRCFQTQRLPEPGRQAASLEKQPEMVGDQKHPQRAA